MLSPLETGTTLGATPGTWEEPGNRVPRTDAWHRRSARGASKARQLARPGVAMPDKAPHLIHGGPYLILPGGNIFFQDRHAGDRQNASRDVPGHGRGTQARFPRGRAATRGSGRGSRRRRRPDPRWRRASAAGFWPDLIRARPGASRPARGLCHRRRRRPDRLLSVGAGQRAAYLLTVHKDVDDLCTTTLSLCMRGGNAGDFAA
jgi:hypothetical protein